MMPIRETLRKIDTGEWVYSIKLILSNKQLQIACGLDLKTDNLKIYDYNTGLLIQSLAGHTSYLYSLEVLNEQYIASGSDDKNVFVWDLNTYTIKYNLNGHTSSVYFLKRISSNLFASTASNGVILVWNWLEGSLFQTLKGHSSGYWYPLVDVFDENTLISGAWDRNIFLWNMSNGNIIHTVNAKITIKFLIMLETGKFTIFLIKTILRPR
jgi:WD40 repeat protein